MNNLNTQVEIERKYLIKMPDIERLKEKYNISKSEIIQTYLNSSDSVERRIRQRVSEGVCNYYYTEKNKISDVSRVEKEKRISSIEYLQLIKERNRALNQIHKNRYCFEYRNLIIEIDIYTFWEDCAIVEVELIDENQEVKLPLELEIIREVTKDKRFKNKNLAENPIISKKSVDNE